MDPLKCINISISMSNHAIFDKLINAGANIHEIQHEIGSFPCTAASALADHNFQAKLLKLGLGRVNILNKLLYSSKIGLLKIAFVV